MYAGEAEKQLSSLANMNQQLANEQYNKKMQAMQLYNALTATGDERRGSALKDATRSGIIGLGANVVDYLRGDNGNDKLNVTNTLMQGYDGGLKAPEEKLNISKEQVSLLDDNGLFPNQKAFMLADALARKEGGRADASQFQTAGYDKKYNKEYKDVKANARNIDAEAIKAKKEFEAQERKDPIGGFLNYAKDKGLNIPTQFEGSKDDQRKQNYDLHNAQIEYFLSKGHRDLARKAESEWIQNEMNIDKSWGDNGKGNYKSLWNTSGPAGEKYETIGVSAQYNENGGYEPAQNFDIPVSVIRKGRPAIAKYINEQEGGKYATNPIRNLRITKPVSGDSQISPESKAYDEGIVNDAWARAKSTKEGSKYAVINGVVTVRKNDGSTTEIRDAQTIEKIKKAGLI